MIRNFWPSMWKILRKRNNLSLPNQDFRYLQYRLRKIVQIQIIVLKKESPKCSSEFLIFSVFSNFITFQ